MLMLPSFRHNCLLPTLTVILLPTELLLAAQDRFDSVPEYKPPPPPKQVKISVVLLAEKYDTEEDVHLGPFLFKETLSVGAAESLIQVR